MPPQACTAATPLGFAVPLEPHAVSVSLPAWEDVCDYERGAARVVNAMQTGYPRFFVHKSIQRLAAWVVEHHAPSGQAPHTTAYLFPTQTIAQGCVEFLSSRDPPVAAHIQPISLQGAEEHVHFYAVLMPIDALSVGKQFWQHTGDGISSRFAERCWALLQPVAQQQQQQRQPPAARASSSSSNARSTSSRGFSRNRHYARGAAADVLDSILGSSSSSSGGAPPASADPPTPTAPTTGIDEDAEVEAMPRAYVEERYGRNLPGTLGPLAKAALRRRIAGVLREQHQTDSNAKHAPTISPTSLDQLSLDDEQAVLNQSGGRAVNNATSTRGVLNLAADDVYLYPGGMSAIFHAHQILLERAKRNGGPVGKSICFGFPYTDTLKILQKWGPGCYFFGNGLDEDIDALDQLLAAEAAAGAAPPLALFTEFPSNPLLRCANLPRLKKLSQKYHFALVVDETIGTFANVEILPWCDIAVSSLTKVFSGDCNVMGGSMVLNPDSRCYADLKMIQADTYEDTYNNEDALFLERNSRNFLPRIEKIDRNTEELCDFFWNHKENHPESTLDDVYYTKFSTPENYLQCLRGQSDAMSTRPGFGGLFSLTFKSSAAAEAFYDALACEKGPSLGTNFTLACPYTLLAHWSELDWALESGVPSALVRVSVGLEDSETLLKWFQDALKAAEAVASK